MSEESSEREGKAAALKSIKIFLASLKEADLESDEGRVKICMVTYLCIHCPLPLYTK